MKPMPLVATALLFAATALPSAAQGQRAAVPAYEVLASPGIAAEAPGADEVYARAMRQRLARFLRESSSRDARQARPAGMAQPWFDVDSTPRVQGADLQAGPGSLVMDAEAARQLRDARLPVTPDVAVGSGAVRRFLLRIEDLAGAGR